MFVAWLSHWQSYHMSYIYTSVTIDKVQYLPFYEPKKFAGLLIKCYISEVFKNVKGGHSHEETSKG